MKTALDLQDMARRCRRLARGSMDGRTTRELTSLAEEFEARARAMAAEGPEPDLLSRGTSGSAAIGKE